MASVALLDGKEILPGGSAHAQLFLAEPVVSSWNQAFVIRSESPVMTIGGGRVLVPAADKMKDAGDIALLSLEQLQSGDEAQRAAAAVYFAGTRSWSMADLSRLAGVDDPQAICDKLEADGELVRLHVSAQRKLIWHKAVLEQMCVRIERSLGKMHDREPLRSTVERSQLTHLLSYCLDTATLDHVLSRMERAKRIRLRDKGVGLSGRGPNLSKSETQLLASLIQRFKDAGSQPPTVKECEAKTEKNRASVASLIALAVTEGDLIEISSDFCLHADVEAEMKQTLAKEIEAAGGLTLSQIRELLATTRKYAVPICEYFDRIGFTKRDGDLRMLGAG